MESNRYSYSGLNLYNSCPLAYYFRYILGVKQDFISHNLIIGKIVHGFIENPSQDIDKLIENQFKGVRYIEGLTKPEIIKEGKRLIEMIKNNPLKRQDGSDIIFKEVEKEFTVPLNDFKLYGFIDAVSSRDEIIEHKTSSQKYTIEKIKSSNQHVIYEIAFRSLYGKSSSGVIYDVIYKNTNPIREVIPVKVSEADIMRVKKWVTDIVQKIRREEFTVYKQIPWLQKRFCNYRNLCQYVNCNFDIKVVYYPYHHIDK